MGMKGPRRGKHKYVQRELHVYNDAVFLRVFVRGWATRLLSGVHTRLCSSMTESPDDYSLIDSGYPKVNEGRESSVPPFSQVGE